jgi:hypothetical protein
MQRDSPHTGSEKKQNEEHGLLPSSGSTEAVPSLSLARGMLEEVKTGLNKIQGFTI